MKTLLERPALYLGLLASLLFPLLRPGSSDPTEPEEQAVWISCKRSGAEDVSYVLLLPPDFDAQVPHPVLFALPPGGQNRAMVERGLELYWEDEGLRRGYVVVSPAAESGFTEAPEKILAVMDEVQAGLTLEGGGFHLAGVSNGGRSAVRFVGLHPERVASLTLLPGAASDAKDLERLSKAAHLPISLHVGGEDSQWIEATTQLALRLEESGAEDVLIRVHEGQGHVLSEDLRGELFDRLDSVSAGIEEEHSFEELLALDGFNTVAVLPLSAGRLLPTSENVTPSWETAVRKLWADLRGHLPESTRGALAQIRAIRLIEGDDSPPGAAVPVEDPRGEWEILIGKNALEEDDLLWVLAHEYGHVLSLGDAEIELAEDVPHLIPSGPRLGEFFGRYWEDTGLFAVLKELNPEATTDPEIEQRVVSHIRDESGLRLEFVSEFAMVSPEEDFTETFAAYVLGGVRGDSGAIEEGGRAKLTWFAETYPRAASIPDPGDKAVLEGR